MKTPPHKNSSFPKIILSLLIVWLLPLNLWAEVIVIKPRKVFERSFAIVVDNQTYQHTGEMIMAYKNMLESEDLSAYVLVSDWEIPCQVKEELKKLYKGKPRLEGAVFIGNIPVAMVRQAQHMTTAFKMNEETFPREQSSVASDRFYDDFDLEFEYIDQDKERPLWHYYNLTASSAQVISSDIYSGRIMPLDNGTDPYQQINQYLQKVLDQRREANPLNHVFSFLGYGSNSECMISWASDKIALSQQFPQINQPGNSLRYMNFGMTSNIKVQLMNELQRPDLDLALLHKHGSIDIQHLSGSIPVNSTRDYVSRIKETLSYIQQSDINQEQREEQLRFAGIPVEWLYHTELSDDFINPKEQQRRGNIYVEDLKSFTPNARLVILDACYNGSFHHPENIAGAYIFNPGKTVVTVGNSVNVLQDNHPNQYLGVLSLGVRIGHLRQPVNTLESHIIGDPTFYFYSPGGRQLNTMISKTKQKPGPWRKLLHSDNPDLIAYSLKMLAGINPEGHSDLLLETMRSSPWYTLRMECLSQLRDINDDNYHKALMLAADDPYELVGRLAIAWMGKKGHPDYIPLLVNKVLDDPYYLRSSVYNANLAISLFDPGEVMQELERQIIARQQMIQADQAVQILENSTKNNEKRMDGWLAILHDKNLEEDQRINTVRFIRNSTLHHLADVFTSIASDQSESEKLRLVMIEALGWFTHSIARQRIIESCILIANDAANQAAIRLEAQKTIARLGG